MCRSSEGRDQCVRTPKVEIQLSIGIIPNSSYQDIVWPCFDNQRGVAMGMSRKRNEVEWLTVALTCWHRIWSRDLDLLSREPPV
jgi:hypothetical protein